MRMHIPKQGLLSAVVTVLANTCNRGHAQTLIDLRTQSKMGILLQPVLPNPRKRGPFYQRHADLEKPSSKPMLSPGKSLWLYSDKYLDPSGRGYPMGSSQPRLPDWAG